MKNGNKQQRRRRHGYIHKSPAVCIVVHDPSGRPMPDAIAAKIINNVTEIALDEGYLFSFTRT